MAQRMYQEGLLRIKKLDATTHVHVEVGKSGRNVVNQTQKSIKRIFQTQ